MIRHSERHRGAKSVLKAIYFAIPTSEEAAAHEHINLVSKGGIIRGGQTNDRRSNARRG